MSIVININISSIINNNNTYKNMSIVININISNLIIITYLRDKNLYTTTNKCLQCLIN